MIEYGNVAAYNAGAVLWIGDLAVPISILVLLYLRFRFQER
jgi:hypothetical protein